MIGVIYARSLNHVIGHQGKLPWHLPEDLKHFKEITEYDSIVMGRHTWESLPVKPLPKRLNYVLTSKPETIKPDSKPYLVSTHDSLDTLVHYYQHSPETKDSNLWIIGGASLIEAALITHADVAWVTEINKNYEGDTIVKPLPSDWVEIYRLHQQSSTGIEFDVVKYERLKDVTKHTSNGPLRSPDSPR